MTTMSNSSQQAKIACPHCQAFIKSPALAAGSLVNCPKCGQGFRLEEERSQGPKSKVQDQGEAVQSSEFSVQSQEGKARLPPPPPSRQLAAEQHAAGAAQPRTPHAAGIHATARHAGQAGGRPEGNAVAEPQAANTKPLVQNPKPKPVDNLVDPNLLAPPPPRTKPKPTSVVVVCQLCGTRIDAPLDRVGQEMKCPDCFTRNVVPALPDNTASQKPTGPTLEGTENFGMSEVVEKPKYRPLVATRGEYEVLSALDPATIEHRLTVPGERSRSKPVQVHSAPEDGDVVLAPPVERVELARDPRTFLPQPELEPENALYDGRYDDGVIGDNVDPRSPDAWKRAPLVYGIIEFLFYPSTLVRWLGYGVGFAALVNFGKFTVESAMNIDFITPFLIPVFCAGCIVLAAPFSAALYAIVQDTGNGQQEVSEWPDWNIVEWIGKACYFPLAAFLTGLPGLLGLAVLLLSGMDFQAYIVIAAIPLLLAWMLLFPPAAYSQLAENGALSLISPLMIQSFRIAGDAWIIFYGYSFVIVLMLLAGVALMAADNFLATGVGACAMVMILFVYARLVGRLIWVTSQRQAKV
jgi:hypothetical protein